MADNLTSGHNYRALSMLAEVHKIIGELLAAGYSENTGHFDENFIYQCFYCRQRLEHVIKEVGRHENSSE